jgi:hypothetical protein
MFSTKEAKGGAEYWSIGVLEYWSIGVLEYWSIGVLEYWSDGVLDRSLVSLRVKHVPKRMRG